MLTSAVLMREIAEFIRSGAFAEEWDAESMSGHKRLRELKNEHAGPNIQALENDLRSRLGPDVRK